MLTVEQWCGSVMFWECVILGKKKKDIKKSIAGRISWKKSGTRGQLIFGVFLGGDTIPVIINQGRRELLFDADGHVP